MTLIDILNNMTVSQLKKEISKHNIKQYSKLKKSDLIALITSVEHRNKFLHLNNEETKNKSQTPIPAPRKKKPQPPIPAPRKKNPQPPIPAPRPIKKNDFSQIIIEKNSIPKKVFTPKFGINFRINKIERKNFIDEVLKHYRGEKSFVKDRTGFVVLKKIDTIRKNLIDKGNLSSDQSTLLVNLNAYRQEILENLYYDFKESHPKISELRGYTHDKNYFTDKLTKKATAYLKKNKNLYN